MAEKTNFSSIFYLIRFVFIAYSLSLTLTVTLVQCDLFNYENDLTLETIFRVRDNSCLLFFQTNLRKESSQEDLKVCPSSSQTGCDTANVVNSFETKAHLFEEIRDHLLHIFNFNPRVTILFGAPTSKFKGFRKLEEEFTARVDKYGFSLLAFSRKHKDRTCLSVINFADKALDSPHWYDEELSLPLILQFVNKHCNLFLKSNGEPYPQEMRRKYILDSLFSVKDISQVQMKHQPVVNKKHIHLNAVKKKTHNKVPKCEVLHSQPSSTDFFKSYLQLSKPVVVKGACKEWSAQAKWTNRFLVKEFGNRKIHVKLVPAADFEGVEPANLWEDHKTFKIPDNIKKQLLYPDLVVVRPAKATMNFSSFVEMIDQKNKQSMENVTGYFEYASIADYMPEIVNDTEEMEFIKDHLHLKHQNMWLSDGNTLGKLHFDPFDNILCMLSGTKEVILFEPHKNHQLYEAHIPEAVLSFNFANLQFRRRGLKDSTSMVMSPVDILKPDFERFPEFGEAYPLNCTINEGDALFMPAFWWHEVQSFPNASEGRNLAVNFWYEPFLTRAFPCPECRLDVNPKYNHLL